MYFFPDLEPAHCSMSGCNCCFLTYIQISQEAGQVVWYSHLLKNFPEFVVIHTVKGFGIINKAKVDVFLKLSCFSYDPTDVGNLTLKDDTVKVLHSICQQFGNLSSGHRTRKGQFSMQSQRKAMPKNVQTIAQLHSSHTLAK